MTMEWSSAGGILAARCGSRSSASGRWAGRWPRTSSRPATSSSPATPTRRAPAALGTTTAPTPAEAAAGADVAILSLPSPAAVEDVALGPDGLGERARPGRQSSSTCRRARRRWPGGSRRSWARGASSFSTRPSAAARPGPRRRRSRSWSAGNAEAVRALPAAARSDGKPRRARRRSRCRPDGEALQQPDRRVHDGRHGRGVPVLDREGVDPVQAYEVFTRSTSDSSVMRRRFPLPGVGLSIRPRGTTRRCSGSTCSSRTSRLALELAAEHGVEAPVGGRPPRAYEAALAAGLGRARLLRRLPGGSARRVDGLAARSCSATAAAAQAAVSLVAFGLPAIGPELREEFGIGLDRARCRPHREPARLRARS